MDENGVSIEVGGVQFEQCTIFTASYCARSIELWVVRRMERDIVRAKGHDSTDTYCPFREKSTTIPFTEVLLWAVQWLKGGSWI